VGWGWANLQSQHSLSPVHPGAAIESSLQLHAGTAHGRLNLLALDPINHTLPANRVILAHDTALPNAQHGIQIRFWQQRTVGIACQLRLATKTPVPKRHKHLLEIGVGRRQVLRTYLSQPLHQPVLGGLKRTLNAPLGVSCQLRHNVTLKDNDSVSFIPIIPGTDANLNC
jgi:hypothetical protein